ncbi:Multidrug resistance protein fnx1 [Fusarium oxysporum f. sp. rapae]|uniref:Multidrug resistance protein fnx1 n=1 Tax=Fusarium oxysporum f. sp. rapae TaxID=485398 RepID=A0A8J5UCG0_FUSOX|nr:Multidrug resistance protein fnx1 [Fusarium oxysporum f. sp. rapae]
MLITHSKFPALSLGYCIVNGKDPQSSNRGNATNGLVNEQSPLLPHGRAKPQPPQQPSDAESTSLKDEPSTRYLVAVFGSIFIGVFLAALDTTIVATLSVPISNTFGSLTLVSWLGSSYLIANAAFQPLSGRLTDIFSRRSGLVVCNVLFGLGTLLCGVATSKWTLLSGRVVGGMGGGGLNAITAFVASDIVPLRRRGVIQGLVHICYGVGAGVGGLFGGWINDLWDWRTAFLSRVPLIAISTILVSITLNDAPTKHNNKSRLSRVDFSGAFTLSLTLILLLLGLNSGGNLVAWSHPLVLVSLSLSVAAAGAFVLVESKWATEPIIPMHLLLDQTVLAACLMNCLVTMILFMATYYVPIFFQVNGYSTTDAGLRLLPQSVGTALSSLTCGFIMKRTGRYRTLGMAVIACSALGFVGLSTMTIQTSTPLVLIYVFLVGMGYGGMLSVSLLATVAAVSHDDQAVATSANYAFRSIGSTIGVTIASVVYRNLLQHDLHQRFDSNEGSSKIIKRILDSLDELKRLPDGWSNGVYKSYEISLRGVFLTGLGVAVLGLVAASFIKEHRLHHTISRADND